MAKVVNLTVHRNTLQRRRARELGREMAHDAAKMGRERHIIAYAVVACDVNGAWTTAWDTGSHIPMWAFPYAVMDTLISSQIDVVEDFKAPLKPKP